MEQNQNEFPLDVNGWMILVRDAQHRPIVEARILFERAMAQFSACYRFLKLYIEKENSDGDIEHLNKLYERYLPSILNIDLYQSYLQHIKQTQSSNPNYPAIMLQACEFAVDKVGLDFLSYPIWNMYLTFLKSSEAQGTFAESQKVNSIRKLYNRVLSTPISGIDMVWKEYCAFEQIANRSTVDKIATDRLRDFNNIKKVSKELENVLKSIIRTSVPLMAQNNQTEKRQLELWVKYINWEKNNPLYYEDSYLLARRVIYAYEQFLQNFPFHSFVWMETTQYIERFYRKLLMEGDQTRANLLAGVCRDLYFRAINGPMKDSMIIHLCYSDFEESFNNYEKCAEVFKKILRFKQADYSLIYISYMKHLYRTVGIDEVRNLFKNARLDNRIDYRIYAWVAKKEYQTNHNALSSLKILDLAIKRFPGDLNLLYTVINHLKSIQDPNLVRASFERLVFMFDTQYSEIIFKEFHKFETEVGSLNSILALEDRTIKLSKTPNINLTLIHNRYFCQQEPEAKNEQSHTIFTPDIQKYSIPDLNQMRPFKPFVFSGNQSVNFPSHAPGGVFPPPPKITEIVNQLPPPEVFTGPFIDVDALIYSISSHVKSDTRERYKYEEDLHEFTAYDEIITDSKMMEDLYRFRQQKNISGIYG